LPPQYVQKWIMEKKERQKDDTMWQTLKESGLKEGRKIGKTEHEEEESKTLPTCYPSTPTLLPINTASSRSDLTKTLQWLNHPSRVQQMTWKINSDQKERPPHHLTYRLHRDAVGTWKRKFWSCNTTQNNMGTKKHQRNYSHSGNPEKINGNKNEPKQQQTPKSKWKDQETI